MSNKAIFLDRDDTLIEDPGYINHPDQVKLLDGAAEALIELKQMGYKLVVVSNQSGVARGIVSEEILGEIHNRLKQLLVEKTAQLDRIYYCPYHPDGVIAKYRKESEMRKPNPGMLLTAANEMDIDLSQSWAVGNSSRDIEAGARAGCKTILLNHRPHQKQTEPDSPSPDYQAVNMKEAVNIIKKHNRSSDNTTVQNRPFAIRPYPKVHQPEKQNDEQHPNQPQEKPAEQNTAESKIEKSLSGILEQLKRMQRNDMFDEFSTMRLLAGIVQIIALFCLIASIWFLMSPNRNDNRVLIAMGFAIVFQLMAMTFYTMHREK